MEVESTVDNVTVVDASLTVVLDIRHPLWDLGNKTRDNQRSRFVSDLVFFFFFLLFIIFIQMEKMRSKFTAGVKKEMKGWCL